MNKAFVREPEPDGKAYCPSCGTLGIAVGRETVDHHVLPEHRTQLADDAGSVILPSAKLLTLICMIASW